MFIGHYESSIDTEKGRTSLPSVYRQKIGQTAIITKGFENSLILVKTQDWEEVISKVTQESFLSGVARQTDRFLLGNAFEITFDKQGRFIVPAKLREYAKIGKTAIFAGVGRRIEVWDKEVWDQHSQYLDINIAQITETLDQKITQK